MNLGYWIIRAFLKVLNWLGFKTDMDA